MGGVSDRHRRGGGGRGGGGGGRLRGRGARRRPDAGRSPVCRPARSSRCCLCSTVPASNISRASITASPSRCCAATFPACPVTSTSSPCRKGNPSPPLRYLHLVVIKR